MSTFPRLAKELNARPKSLFIVHFFYCNTLRKMSSIILLHLLLGLFGTNKISRSTIFLDCKLQPSTKNLPVFKSLWSISPFFFLASSAFSHLAAEYNVATSYINIDKFGNASDAVRIFSRFSRIQRLGVVLNYDCSISKEILELVWINRNYF